jgi:hypothetical protein
LGRRSDQHCLLSDATLSDFPDALQAALNKSVSWPGVHLTGSCGSGPGMEAFFDENQANAHRLGFVW